MLAYPNRWLPTLLTILGISAIASEALGQGNTFNPYGNSGYADYREFGTPMLSNNPALPGQAVLNSQPLINRPRSNTYQQYANELEGNTVDPATARRGGANVPYYQAYQRLNQQYNRVYQPNNTDQDKAFYDRQRQRDEAFAKALKEPDAAKRAKLLRQVELDSIDRPASPRAGTSASRSTAVPKPLTAPSARASAPVERRTPAPSPFGSTSSRRPSSSARAVAPGRSSAPSPTAPAAAVRPTRPAPPPTGDAPDSAPASGPR